MKKIFAVVLLLALALLALTGCSNGVKDTVAAIDKIAQAEDKTGKREAIAAAEELYSALDDEQKAKVTNSSVLFVAQAERAIEKIGYVSDIIPVSPVQKEGLINSANAAYNKLTAEEKKLVSNYDELKSANSLLKSAIALRDEAQEYAAKLFTRCAKLFNRSESIYVKRVWYSTTGVGNSFTFEFDLKNSYGIVETVYYGTRLPLLEMNDENLKLASQGLVFTGDSMYFSEGETGAMDDEYAVQLNADTIQDYFRKNR